MPFTNESIVSVDFTDMPARMWISPNKGFSPFCVDMHDRCSWAGKADLHNVDNIT